MARIFDMKVKVCKYVEIGAFNRFKLDDVARIVDSMRLNHRSSDEELLSAILHVFGIRDALCWLVSVFGFLKYVGLFSILYLIVKMLKAFVFLFNVWRGVTWRVIRLSVLLFTIDLSESILSKIALRGTIIAASLDVVISVVGLYVEYLMLAEPVFSFFRLVCSNDVSSIITRSAPVLVVLRANEIAEEIALKRRDLVDATVELENLR